jgi:hypothetical protein
MVNANSASWNNGQLTPALDLLIDQGVSIFRVIVDKEDLKRPTTTRIPMSSIGVFTTRSTQREVRGLEHDCLSEPEGHRRASC